MFSNIKFLLKETKEKTFIREASFYGIVKFYKKMQNKLTLVSFIDNSCDEKDKLKCNIFSVNDLNWKLGDIILCEKMEVFFFFKYFLELNIKLNKFKIHLYKGVPQGCGTEKKLYWMCFPNALDYSYFSRDHFYMRSVVKEEYIQQINLLRKCKRHINNDNALIDVATVFEGIDKDAESIEKSVNDDKYVNTEMINEVSEMPVNAEPFINAEMLRVTTEVPVVIEPSTNAEMINKSESPTIVEPLVNAEVVNVASEMHMFDEPQVYEEAMRVITEVPVFNEPLVESEIIEQWPFIIIWH